MFPTSLERWRGYLVILMCGLFCPSWCLLIRFGFANPCWIPTWGKSCHLLPPLCVAGKGDLWLISWKSCRWLQTTGPTYVVPRALSARLACCFGLGYWSLGQCLTCREVEQASLLVAHNRWQLTRPYAIEASIWLASSCSRSLLASSCSCSWQASMIHMIMTSMTIM